MLSFRDILLVNFHGLGRDLNSILSQTTTLDLGAASLDSGLSSFVLGNLLQNQIGKVGSLASSTGVSGVKDGVVFMVAWHELVEQVEIIGVNLLQ